MTDKTHTPLPWFAVQQLSGHAYDINVGPNYYDQSVASLHSNQIIGSDAKADAEFIVRACNAHDDLVAALERATDQLEHSVMGGRINTRIVDEILERKALAKARGEA